MVESPIPPQPTATLQPPTPEQRVLPSQTTRYPPTISSPLQWRPRHCITLPSYTPLLPGGPIVTDESSLYSPYQARRGPAAREERLEQAFAHPEDVEIQLGGIDELKPTRCKVARHSRRHYCSSQVALFFFCSLQGYLSKSWFDLKTDIVKCYYKVDSRAYRSRPTLVRLYNPTSYNPICINGTHLTKLLSPTVSRSFAIA
jgi:hypothetical protein